MCAGVFCSIPLQRIARCSARAASAFVPRWEHPQGDRVVNIHRIFCAALLALVAGTSMATAAQAPQMGAGAPAKATVDQLAWVTGAWTGRLGDRTIEQHWSAPVAGSIIAMYRSIQNDRATLYELLAIEQEGNGVVLRIKHFAPGPGLVGQEGKDESMNNTLVALEGHTAVFEGGTPASPTRITFTSPDPAVLNIVVERQRDGRPVATEFKYTRIKP
jgi:hypothetical protein